MNARTRFAVLVLLTSCADKRSHDNLDLAESHDTMKAAATASPVMAGAGSGAVPANEKAQKLDDAPGRAEGRMQANKTAPAAPSATKDADGGGAVAETKTRSWFPETFLFEPLVVTDDSGNATVPVKVPDRLTTWRVLALAHARNGAQGGAVTSFLGTLPTYVDPVVPPFLTAGDEVKLPIQIVNTTDAAVATTLVVDAKGAQLSGAGGTRSIPAGGSVVDYATVRADEPGTVALRAVLAGSDAVERTFDVVPNGMPVRQSRSGTLAAPRSLPIDVPAGAANARVRLLVYPGALALLRSELAAANGRGGAEDDAYALLLAGTAPALLDSLGDKPDTEALRTATLVATQRAIRAARTLDVTSATLLTEAALAHPDSAVLGRLGERAAAYLAQHQRPDGTFAGGAGWTLQRVLDATADGVRAVGAANATAPQRQRATAVGVRAGSAFARNASQIKDGYTAAAIVASGVGGPLADSLKPTILAAIKDGGDGTKYLEVPPGVVRADGSVPTRMEATALAVLALKSDPKAPLAELGSTLLGGYDPLFGWGDGRANLACLRAVLELFKSPVPANVAITLLMDGKPVTNGSFDASKLKDVMVVEAPVADVAGSHTWQLTAEPAVPGLGFSLTVQAWTPWPKQQVKNGLELSVPTVTSASVGTPQTILLSAVAPAGVAIHVRHALPAGVQVDTPSLQAMVDGGAITRFQVADGSVDLWSLPLQPGQTWRAGYRAIPTLSGTLHTGASIIEAGGAQIFVPPVTWSVR